MCLHLLCAIKLLNYSMGAIKLNNKTYLVTMCKI